MSAGETNVQFREHDIEFLQKRAKLWLEAVLGEKYGDSTFPELISNGNLLWRVSKYITREVTGTSPATPEVSPKTVARLDSKSSGKYLPYANVDTFLKTCKKLGLAEVELFTPPDAIDGKDIRQVCNAIRTLARKARAQHINVPDFEDVNRPLPMPKEKVEEMKENLQQAYSSPVSPTVLSPELDTQKSERVQIISRFLSAKSNSFKIPDGDSGSRSPSEPSSPATPGRLKSFTTKDSPLSTSPAAIGGSDKPRLIKSVSDAGPSPIRVKSLDDRVAATPILIASDEPKSDKALTTPSGSPGLPLDQPNEGSSPFSQKSLGSYRHANPHFTKMPSLQSNADDRPIEVAATHPKPENAPSSPAVSTPSTPAIATTPTSDISSDRQADRAKELPTLAKLGLGSYRHARPHFSFKKSDSTDSQDTQPGASTPKAPNGKSKAPSSNKIVEKDPKSTVQQTESPGRTSFGPATQGSQRSAPPKEGASKPETKAHGLQLKRRLWVPLAAGALAFVGTLLVVKTRDPVVYEVKEGDTLAKISRKVGQDNWEELVKLNPRISNPNLIYPSERLKLPTK